MGALFAGVKRGRGLVRTARGTAVAARRLPQNPRDKIIEYQASRVSFFSSLGFPMTSKGEPSSTVRARTGATRRGVCSLAVQKKAGLVQPCALLRSAAPVTTAANQRSTYTLLNFHTQSAGPDFLFVTLNSTCLGGLLLQNGGNSNKLFPLGRRLKQTRKKKNIFAFLRQINSMPHQPRPLFFSSPI